MSSKRGSKKKGSTKGSNKGKAAQAAASPRKPDAAELVNEVIEGYSKDPTKPEYAAFNMFLQSQKIKAEDDVKSRINTKEFRLKTTRETLEEIRKNPSLLASAEYAFVREFVAEYNKRAPQAAPKKEAQKPKKVEDEDDEEEDEEADAEIPDLEDDEDEKETPAPKPSKEKPAAKQAPKEAKVEEVEEEAEEKEPEPDEFDKAVLDHDELDEDVHDFDQTKEPSDDDVEKAGEFRAKGKDALAAGKFDVAIENFTKALEFNPQSTFILADRASAFMKAKKPNNAIQDSNKALAINPDSAKAFRARAQAHLLLGSWEAAHKDLANSQQIDYDADIQALLTKLQPKVDRIRSKKYKQERKDKEAALKKRMEDLKAQRARERAEAEAEAEEAAAGGGFGGGFGGGGFPGGPGGAGGPPPGLFSDPEILAGIQNPKVMAALQSLMSEGPSALAKITDPEVLRIVSKIAAGMQGAGVGGGRGAGGAGAGGDHGHSHGPGEHGHSHGPGEHGHSHGPDGHQHDDDEEEEEEEEEEEAGAGSSNVHVPDDLLD